jgi:LTXXQ motif family protein
MNSLSRSGALRSGRVLGNPAARAQIAAAAAMAGWHGGAANGWWQHNGGGYGWVGPLFWPFAYHDIYDYAIWGDGIGFWGYGYPDIYAGVFAPYGYDDLAGYLPQRWSSRRHGSFAPIGPMCGDDSRDIAGLPIDQIAEAVQPTEAQRAALEELGNASIAAAQTIRAACPTQIILTAPGRLAAMQQRVEAMIAAVASVRPPLDKFYGLLDDEQKARLNALAEDQRKSSAASNAKGPIAQNCSAAQPAAQDWPTSEIEARLHPNDTQRGALQTLQDASAQAAEMLKAACQADEAMTPPARLVAVNRRLDTMLKAVKLVRAALEDFYATLSDEQKAQFEAIGPRRTA